MKSHTFVTIFVIAIFSILVTACNVPGVDVSTPDPGFIYTQAAQTAAVLPTRIPPTTAPTMVVTQEPPTPTIIATASATPTLVPTSTPTTIASPTSGTCSNQAKFVSDVTIPDDTELLSGQEFIKTWRLENTGTCTWTNQYALAFSDGDMMNAISPSPLTGSTPPGSTLDVSISLKAPGTVGTYKGSWLLQDPSGIKFGTGTRSDQTFFVQIKVVEGVSELNLGSPSWRDDMDNANNWYLLDTDNTKFTEGEGVLVMKSIHPGGGEEWGLSDQNSMEDYYLQATFIVGDVCSGLDRYGLLGRAPGENEGYVFEFSCDGQYRLYTWENETYTALQNWRSAASIKAGSGKTNVMGLWMQGTTIRLYANGYKIAEFTDNTFDQGQFGLVIGSVNTENFNISVDRVEYWEFSQ